MPGLPLPACETTCSQSRTADHMCLQHSWRCLSYKIQAKRKRRVQISVSFPGNVNGEVQLQNLFPLYVLLAQPDSDTNVLEQSLKEILFGASCRLNHSVHH
ncbi:hypothetical protein J5N97_001836 [Dioscorea zingiberensis]|uniref:DUF7651 domain-containing protein n=1 Tax=Dioscorea zingiberensis TaxID=325984 RepID=A0A9D5H1X3_9LILI|nr:hypothetical protein J5N97_001836 [Dioscorea zingiberensis]